MSRLGRVLRTVRARTALAATAVVGVSLVLGAVAIVSVQRSLLQDDLDATLQARADDLAILIGETSDVGTLQVRRREEALVQIVDADGQVLAASENVTGDEPVVDPTVFGRFTVDGLPIDEDERFRILVQAAGEPGASETLIVAGSLESLDESLGTLVDVLLWAIPSLMLVVAATAWLMAGRALRPVEAIREQVARISDEHLDRRVPEPASRDEVARLAGTMNLMLERLEASWRRQDRFVADASHELKSPLTAMRSHLDVDLAHDTDADWRATHELLRDEIDQLQQLIDDLLFLARLDEGGPSCDEPVDLDDVVFTEVERLRDRTTAQIDVSGVSAGQVLGERRSLRRLVRNLLDNAGNHARSTVTVTLFEAGPIVTLVVADDGPGVADELAATVFERFATADHARERDGGTGLGLAIARGIATRHGGTIDLHQRAGDGARFVVSLPSGPTST